MLFNSNSQVTYCVIFGTKCVTVEIFVTSNVTYSMELLCILLNMLPLTQCD